MRFTQASIPGVWTIDADSHEDERGRFFRAWCAREFAHYQVEPAPEAKLVRCTRGAIFDVALDLRPQSLTFRQWFGIKLSAANGRMLLVPGGCAHGYQTLEDETEMHYMTSAVYTLSAAHGVRFDDPAFGIEWPLPATAVSKQDRDWPLVAAHTATIAKP
jgi:dTDP-4-dehydrorhamnose 3,5-epimerase